MTNEDFNIVSSQLLSSLIVKTLVFWKLCHFNCKDVKPQQDGTWRCDWSTVVDMQIPSWNIGQYFATPDLSFSVASLTVVSTLISDAHRAWLMKVSVLINLLRPLNVGPVQAAAAAAATVTQQCVMKPPYGRLSSGGRFTLYQLGECYLNKRSRCQLASLPEGHSIKRAINSSPIEVHNNSGRENMTAGGIWN